MHRRLRLLLDLRSAMHSALAEAYMHLHMIVEVSLRMPSFGRGAVLSSEARVDEGGAFGLWMHEVEL